VRDFENRTTTMKTIIFISSIFYILGLKLGHKTDIFKKAIPVEKVVSNTITTKINQSSCFMCFNSEEKKLIETDSVKCENNKTYLKIN
jgi:hypothetical protein